MPATSISDQQRFDPSSVKSFQFTYRQLEADGTIRLGYALDDIDFEEVIRIPAPNRHNEAADRLLDLLHWTAGISYYKAAAPDRLVCETGAPPAAAGDLLTALYSEGLGEFAVVNGLPHLPHPQFLRADPDAVLDRRDDPGSLRRLLVPVGGGKDSAVAIEIARTSGLETTLFSVGDATPIRATAEVARLPRHLATRTLDQTLLELNRAGARNGHVPVTAIISAIALLVADTQGLDAVLLANERSASAGSLFWNGIEVNHQFAKSRQAERLLAAAVAEIPGAPRIFSILRPASELAIARAFAGKLTAYHSSFTSCNTVFRLDPATRNRSWCCNCDKCRFVYLILAPFMPPEQLISIFGKDLLDDPSQYDGFARLTATGGSKPFECVGEVDDSLAAIYLLAAAPQWRDRTVVRRLAEVVLGEKPFSQERVDAQFEFDDDHDIPEMLMPAVHEVLGT
ncbi:MAG: hypothetical protein ACP5H2_00110 [Solirubrobacteraceae bacterium]